MSRSRAPALIRLTASKEPQSLQHCNVTIHDDEPRPVPRSLVFSMVRNLRVVKVGLSLHESPGLDQRASAGLRHVGDPQVLNNDDAVVLGSPGAI